MQSVSFSICLTASVLQMKRQLYSVLNYSSISVSVKCQVHDSKEYSVKSCVRVSV
jgi:hypothetical protein